jgi:hypothetical protein
LESTHSSDKSIKELWKGLEGTYQFVLQNNEKSFLLTEELYLLAVSSRRSTEDVRIRIDDVTELFLPSTNAISSGSFVKLEPIVISE